MPIPTILIRVVRRFRALFRAQAVDADAQEEMRLHIDLEAKSLAHRDGLTASEAWRQATIAFGGLAQMQERHRDVRGVRGLEELWRDVRQALRALRRSPGFTIPAVLLLALGIGATTAMYSALHAVLLTRLPYPHDEQLVVLNEQDSPTNRWTLSVADFRGVEQWKQTLSSVGALRGRRAAVITPGAEPERILTGAITSGFLPTLGVSVARGRGFAAGDDAPGAPPVAIVTRAFAEKRYGSDAAALGGAVTIDGVTNTIVGVLPASVSDLAGVRAEIWPALQLAPPTRRGPFGLFVIGRLKSGITLPAAERDLAGISARLLSLWTADFRDAAARLVPASLRTRILGNAPQVLSILAAAVGLVLLIAVSNVASLMLVRGIGRQREVGLRAILGASRGRLTRWLVTESLMVAGVGAALGIGIGALALKLFVASGPQIARIALARLDGGAVAFALVLAIVVGLVIGLYPLTMLLRQTSSAALRDGSRTVGASRATNTARGALVVAEFALALPLLACAALLLSGFLRLQGMGPGFDPRSVYTLRVSLPAANYRGDSAIAPYWTRALAQVHEVPGVVAAGLNTAMPPADPTIGNNNFDLVDHPVGEGRPQPNSTWIAVTAEYFSALRVPLIDGRMFNAGDSAAAPPVVVVSRSWAQRYFPEGKVVGRQMIEGGCIQCPRTTVIGVVGDVQYSGLGGSADAVYNPLTAQWSRDVVLFVRTIGASGSVGEKLRTALRAIDRGVPLQDGAPMEARLSASVTQQRTLAAIVSGFAVVAVVLAAIGIFGTLSYTVDLRRREIGVRIALGAGHQAVVGLIVWRGLRYAGVGAVVGIALALVGTRQLAGNLLGVDVSAPTTLAAATALLLGVAAVASWLPARRAASVNPVEAIRAD